MSFFFGDSGIIEIIKAQDKIENLKKSISGLKEEKEKLAKEIENLDKNPLALEKKAREKLWLMKKNEMVIVIVRNKDKHNEKLSAAKGKE
jgi:cell division protein FtsB